MAMTDHLTDKKIWLAPLAGLTDKPFRIVCKRNEADVLVTEMVSSDGLVYDYERSIRYALYTEEERPIGVQLFGSRPDVMAKACRVILQFKPDFIDINMGCPVKKVVKRGSGSALLKNPSTAVKIVQAMKDTIVSTGTPLSVKIRSGWDKNDINAVEFAQFLEEAGADMLIVHPRTTSQLYSGYSDWSVIKAVKSAVKIPVVGNGDVKSTADAIRMLEETNCDSVMIGRGALGKPWLFQEIKSYLLTGINRQLSFNVKFEIIKEHMELALKNKESERALKEMRTHLCYYTKGYKGGNKVRNLINKTNNKDEILKMIGDLYEQQD